MKVQKVKGLPITNQVFKSHSKLNETNNRVFYDIDSADSAVATDSLYAPFLPLLVNKIKKAYRIAFPKQVVQEAENIKTEIDDLVLNHRFDAVA